MSGYNTVATYIVIYSNKLIIGKPEQAPHWPAVNAGIVCTYGE